MMWVRGRASPVRTKWLDKLQSGCAWGTSVLWDCWTRKAACLCLDGSSPWMSAVMAL